MFIQGDYTQLQQVLINLINNARDAVIGVATPVISIAVDFPSLSNRLKKKYPKVDLDGYARISIADNGHGIDKDYMGKIFDPFFTLKEVGKGTGLGLAMVKGTIESHGGFIDVDTNLEAGTKFSILLPLANADAHTGVNVNTGTDVVYHKEESLILLVDDENDVREVNRAILEDFGYTVIEAVDGLQAIEKFSDFEGEIKLVMMDVVMPRMGGIKAAERIREISSSVPIIFATGYDRTQVLGESEASLEKCSIITKPFKMNELSQMISQMVD